MTRKQVIFWLDDNNPEEAELLAYIDKLKRERKFQPTMRKALKSAANIQDPIKQHLERLEQLFLQQNTAVPHAKPLMLNEPAFDTEDTIEIKKATGGRGEWNGLISMALLNGCLDTLPIEALEYGVSSGRIPPIAIKKKVPTENKDKGIKKMDVPQFEAPLFEDDDKISLIPIGSENHAK